MGLEGLSRSPEALLRGSKDLLRGPEDLLRRGRIQQKLERMETPDVAVDPAEESTNEKPNMQVHYGKCRKPQTIQ